MPGDFPGDRQLLLVDGVVAGGHHLGVERHVYDHHSKGLGHERQHVGVVVGEVVAPQERVVDAAPITRTEVAFIVAGLAAEEVDLGIGLAAILPSQQAAGRNPDQVEAVSVGSGR